MSRPTRPGATHPTFLRALHAAWLVVLALLLAVGPVAAADPSPSPAPQGPLRMVARPLLGGTARPGAWMAIRVQLENDGPAVSGELQVSGGQQRDTRYTLPVELATGARQEHLLYAQPDWAGKGLTVRLVADGETKLSQPLTTRSVDAWTPTIVVVAERPEGIVSDIRAGATTPNIAAPVIITIAPGDLPPRVEAWSAIDRLVWQDVDSSTLGEDQLTALRGWVGAGVRRMGGPKRGCMACAAA